LIDNGDNILPLTTNSNTQEKREAGKVNKMRVNSWLQSVTAVWLRSSCLWDDYVHWRSAARHVRCV